MCQSFHTPVSQLRTSSAIPLGSSSSEVTTATRERYVTERDDIYMELKGHSSTNLGNKKVA